MTKHLTDKQLAKKNEGYNPDRAGESITVFCSQARAELHAKLVKPNVADEEAFTAYITAKVAIRNMNYNELRAALLSSRSVEAV